MSTVIKPELSLKNKYWIERHRYYELKHFCLQYTTWKKLYDSINSINSPTIDYVISKTNKNGNPTEKYAIARTYLKDRIEMIDRVAKKTDETLYHYILIGVTQGYTYTYLKTTMNIPCCRDKYYELYRKFFWLLDKERC